jgi:hypothetical protein
VCDVCKYSFFAIGVDRDRRYFIYSINSGESFLSDGSYLAVATRDCPPHRCDFPRQLCMRPSAQYQQESANECRDLPDQCLLAANGGQPLPTAAPPTESPAPRNLATSAAGGTQQPKAEIATTAAASLGEFLNFF